MKRWTVKAFSAAAVAVMGFNAAAWAVEPSQADMAEQIRQLRQEVTALKDQKSSTDLSVAPSATDAVRTDAAGRTISLADKVALLPAGYEKGKFIIQSEDGKFSFAPSFQVQVRYVANYIDNAPSDAEGDESIEQGFEIRRAKFGFAGKMFGDFHYKFVWATNRSGPATGNVFLEDAQVSYKVSERLQVVGGQFKDPVHHEELISSSKQMAADRSLVNEMLGGGVTDRIQGLGLEFTQGPLFATAVFHDGINSDNTSFRDSPSNATDWGFGGRAEYLVFGDKKAYGDFAAFGNKDSMLVIGVGGDATGAASSNIYLYTVDAQFETANGLAIYGAALGRTIEPHGDADSTSDIGGVIQVGYMFTPKLEGFGRYDVIDLDGADKLTHEFTAGVNYFMNGHNAKLTVDVTILPNGSESDSGLGILDSNEEFQAVGRVQFQLAI